MNKAIRSQSFIKPGLVNTLLILTKSYFVIIVKLLLYSNFSFSPIKKRFSFILFLANFRKTATACIVLCIMFWSINSSAQVTTLSAWSNIYHGTLTTAQTATVNIPAGTGTSRLLVVGIASNRVSAGTRTVTLTYGGQSLTSANDDMGVSLFQHTGLYYLNEAGIDAAVGTTLSVTVGGSTSRITDVWVSVYDYVDQTSPITDSKNYNSSSITSALSFSPSLTINTNDQAVEVITCHRTGSTTLRTIGYATNWTLSNEQTSTVTDAIRNVVVNRSISGSNITDATSTSFSAANNTYGSMTGISLKYLPPPTLTLVNPTTAVGATNVCAAATNVPIHAFKITGSGGGGTLTNFAFTTTGSYTAAELANFEIWYNTSNNLGSATLLATNSSPGGPGVQTFPAFSHAIGNTTEYYWITMDVDASVTGGHTLTVSASVSGNMTTTAGKAGSASASGQQTLRASLSAVSIAPTTTQNFCSNGTGTLLTATETGGGTITSRQWGKRSVSGGAITNIGGATGNTYTPTGASLGAGTWYVVCTSTPTCGAAVVSNEVIVNVNAPAAPTITITENSGNSANDGIICNSTSVTLTSSAATSYLWSGGGAVTQGITVSPASNTTYTVTITSGGCTNSASQLITVNTNPVATAASNSPVSLGGTLIVTGGPGGMTAYAWSGPNSYSDATQSPTVTTNFDPVTMVGTYTITITNNNGCLSTASTAVIAGGIYKSNVANGNWSNISSWLISYDGGSTWNSAVAYPTIANSASVEICLGHTIRADVVISSSNTTVDDGGTLNIPATNYRLTYSAGHSLTNNGTITLNAGGSQTNPTFPSPTWDGYGLIIDGGTLTNNLIDTNRMWIGSQGVLSYSVTTGGTLITNNGYIENNGGYYFWTGSCPSGGNMNISYDGIYYYCSNHAGGYTATFNNYGTVDNYSVTNCNSGWYRAGLCSFYDFNNYGTFGNFNTRAAVVVYHDLVNYNGGSINNGSNFTTYGTATNHGIYNEDWATNVDNGSSFVNATDGVFNLFSDGAIRIETGTSGGAQFTNDGIINNNNLYSPGSLNGIDLISTKGTTPTSTAFTNSSTGIIYNLGPIWNTGNFINNGTIYNDNTNSHANIYNTYSGSYHGIFTNNNIIYDNGPIYLGRYTSFTNAAGSQFIYQTNTGSITSYDATYYINYQGTALLDYNGTAAQTTSAMEWPTSGNIPTYVKIDNSSGAANGVTLNAGRTIANQLTLTNGALKLNTNTLTINNPSTTAITVTSGYIVSEQNLAVNASKLLWNCGTSTGSYVFPFGANDGSYIPLTINKTSAGSANITASTRATNTSDNTPWAGLSDVAVVAHMNCLNGGNGAVPSVIDRWWDITPSAALTADVTFSYRGSENTTSAPTTNLAVQHWNGTFWNNGKGGTEGSHNSTGIAGIASGVGSVTVTGLTEFSPYIIDLESNFLPVELLSFHASCKDDKVKLNWSTASETNNDFFTVEKSHDGMSFENLANIPGAGNSNLLNVYSYSDNSPYSDITYYKLKQTDFDGSSNYSDVINTTCSSDEQLSVTLSFADGDLSLIISNAKSDYSLSIFEVSGKLVYSKDIIKNSEQTQQLILSSDLFSPGIYFIQLQSKDENLIQKFMVR